MKEVIHIHIGQAGVQTGMNCWAQYCAEHSIDPSSGEYQPQHGSSGDSQSQHLEDAAWNSFFCETESGTFVPRAIFLDLDPTTVDEIRRGECKNLFSPESLISGKEDAANNYERGMEISRSIRGEVNNQIRRQAELCTGLEGIIVTHAIGGGTGSAVGDKVFAHLQTEFHKVPRMAMTITPSPSVLTSVVEPYNAILALADSLHSTDLNVLFDNESLYDQCRLRLGNPSPNYKDINSLFADVASDMTANMRFGGPLNSSVDNLRTNLVPYPRIHFLTCAHGPLSASQDDADKRVGSVAEMTNEVFKPSNFLCKGTTSRYNPKFMAVTLMFRGDVNVADTNAVIASQKCRRSFQVVDWCPTGFKVGVCPTARAQPHKKDSTVERKSSKSVLNLFNSDAVNGKLRSLCKDFDKMYAKRAFVHWYVGGGQSEGIFSEARENIESVITDYEDVCKETEDNDDDDDSEDSDY